MASHNDYLFVCVCHLKEDEELEMFEKKKKRENERFLLMSTRSDLVQGEGK